MNFKMVAIDIDGTLLDSNGELPLENARAIERTIKEGITVVLVTGRRYGTARQIADLLRLSSPLIAHNGALIRSPSDGERIASWFLSTDIASEILTKTASFLPYIVLHKDTRCGGQLVAHPLCKINVPLQAYFDKLPQAVCQQESLRNAIDGDLIQIMFSGVLQKMLEIEQHLLESGIIGQIKLTKTYYPEKDLGIIDILDKHCSKRRALEYLTTALGYQPKEILAIGDNHNDLEMLEYAGIGVVVSNCVEELKGRGFAETSSNNDCGVAQALETFVFMKE
jgi:Cof subfamily protein (haloacid dehalogenase superfamily)